MMITLFYIWGAINALLVLFTIKTINYSLVSNNKGGVDNNKVVDLNKKNFFKFNLFILWTLVGLFHHSMMVYFIFYIILIYLLRIVHRKYNWLVNPTSFNINLNKSIRVLHFLLIVLPVINYFFFQINITEKFYSIF